VGEVRGDVVGDRVGVGAARDQAAAGAGGGAGAVGAARRGDEARAGRVVVGQRVTGAVRGARVVHRDREDLVRTSGGGIRASGLRHLQVRRAVDRGGRGGAVVAVVRVAGCVGGDRR